MYTLQISNFKSTNTISRLFNLLHSEFTDITLLPCDNVCREYVVFENNKEIGSITLN